MGRLAALQAPAAVRAVDGGGREGEGAARTDANADADADAVLPGLLLGGIGALDAVRAAASATKRFFVLSLVESRHELPAWVVAEGNAGVVWLHVPLADRTDQEVLSVFAATNAFIDRGRREGTVLVHCRAGVSRSAAVVVAYLMWKYGHSLKDALRIVRQRRPITQPNTGFMKQLWWYELLGCSLEHPASPTVVAYRKLYPVPTALVVAPLR